MYIFFIYFNYDYAFNYKAIKEKEVNILHILSGMQLANVIRFALYIHQIYSFPAISEIPLEFHYCMTSFAIYIYFLICFFLFLFFSFFLFQSQYRGFSVCDDLDLRHFVDTTLEIMDSIYRLSSTFL